MLPQGGFHPVDLSLAGAVTAGWRADTEAFACVAEGVDIGAARGQHMMPFGGSALAALGRFKFRAQPPQALRDAVDWLGRRRTEPRLGEAMIALHADHDRDPGESRKQQRECQQRKRAHAVKCRRATLRLQAAYLGLDAVLPVGAGIVAAIVVPWGYSRATARDVTARWPTWLLGLPPLAFQAHVAGLAAEVLTFAILTLIMIAATVLPLVPPGRLPRLQRLISARCS